MAAGSLEPGPPALGHQRDARVRRADRAARATAARTAGATAARTAAAKASKPRPAAAAKAVAKGGGPENPLADLSALQTATTARRVKAPPPGGTLASRGPQRLLLTEFLACFTVLGLAAIVAPPASAPGGGVPRLMLKSSALAGLFLVLSLVASAGGRGAKAAAGLGGLVTVAYLVSSPDATQVFDWASGFFTASNAAGAGSAGAEGLGAQGSAGAVGAVVDQGVQSVVSGLAASSAQGGATYRVSQYPDWDTAPPSAASVV